MHDDGVLGDLRHALGVEAVAAGVLALGGEERGVHPLALDAQHHDGVALGQGAVEVVRHLAGPGTDADGHEGGRGDEGDLGAEGVEEVDVGAGDAAVEDVADYGDAPAGQVAAEAGVAADEAAAQGEGVEEAWVGCWWVPSPALITGASIQPELASR